MKICYYCGSEATTVEHVPPQGIFPRRKDSPDGRDYRNQLITVPSCEVHNTGKSKEDEYLLYILTMSLPSNQLAKHQFLTKTMRAIERRPKLIETLLTETRNVVIHDIVSDTWEETVALRPDESRLIAMFSCIAKGLYYHERHTPWLGSISVLIEFMLSFDDLAKNESQRLLVEHLDTMLGEQPLKGNNLDVFGYQLVEADGKILGRLHFYENSKVSVVFADDV